MGNVMYVRMEVFIMQMSRYVRIVQQEQFMIQKFINAYPKKKITSQIPTLLQIYLMEESVKHSGTTNITALKTLILILKIALKKLHTMMEISA